MHGSRPDYGNDVRQPKRRDVSDKSPARQPQPHQRPRSVVVGGRSGDGRPDLPLPDTREMDRYLEEMLDRRNIPEKQRFKMRTLNASVKAEFIRQDWAEMQQAKRAEAKQLQATATEASASGAHSEPRPVADGVPAPEGGSGSISEGEAKRKIRRKRGMSFTLSRKPWLQAGSLSSKTSTATVGDSSNLGRLFRTKSSDSLASERPLSTSSKAGVCSKGHDTPKALGSGGFGAGALAKLKPQQAPADFVAYLRREHKLELMEVGRLHKLRILLRNETVSWTDDFVRSGGMEEVVGLLYRLMDTEWREEHEDALLHESLLCLKALSTTDLALHQMGGIQAALFPRLLHLLFDPQKKGPSEFATRGIVTAILLTYIACESATTDTRGCYAGRVARAAAVLAHLRDRKRPEADLPVPFVLEMRRERPYQAWCHEVVGVTKEVFWIFLHHENAIELLDKTADRPPRSESLGENDSDMAYMARHFAQDRPPVPAAPYVGGVEWDATNYLASHLDLLNAIVACTPGGAVARNRLRAALRVSGWERWLGGSLRLCKEKFYGALHDGMRTWVAAAAEDGWDVDAVRFGPRGNMPGHIANGRRLEPPPRLELPGLGVGEGTEDSNWLG